jgi:DNA-binding NarL/FixJ family response regulator
MTNAIAIGSGELIGAPATTLSIVPTATAPAYIVAPDLATIAALAGKGCVVVPDGSGMSRVSTPSLKRTSAERQETLKSFAARRVRAVRAVIADDELLLREGVARLLDEAGIEVVAQAGDAPDLLRKVGAHQPDVAIVDVRMPPDLTDDGLRAAIEIRRRWPEVGVVVLSQHLVERFVAELLGDDAHGVGYLLKHRVADLNYFLEAVRTVAEGGTALDPEVVGRMLGRRRREDPLEALTPREREVLQLMAEGLSNKGIAERLVVGAPAVEKHVTAIFSKLDLGYDRSESRRVLAVLTLLRAAGEPAASSRPDRK